MASCLPLLLIAPHFHTVRCSSPTVCAHQTSREVDDEDVNRKHLCYGKCSQSDGLRMIDCYSMLCRLDSSAHQPRVIEIPDGLRVSPLCASWRCWSSWCAYTAAARCCYRLSLCHVQARCPVSDAKRTSACCFGPGRYLADVRARSQPDCLLAVQVTALQRKRPRQVQRRRRAPQTWRPTMSPTPPPQRPPRRRNP